MINAYVEVHMQLMHTYRCIHTEYVCMQLSKTDEKHIYHFQDFADFYSELAGKICREDGMADPLCFVPAQQCVLDIMEKRFVINLGKADK